MVVVLLSLWSPRKAALYLSATFATLLLTVDTLLSPRQSGIAPAIVNHLAVAAVIWLTVVSCMRRRSSVPEQTAEALRASEERF